MQPGSAVAATLAKSLTSSIMVNTSPGTAAGTFATITKALGQAGVSSISAQGAVQVITTGFTFTSILCIISRKLVKHDSQALQ